MDIRHTIALYMSMIFVKGLIFSSYASGMMKAPMQIRTSLYVACFVFEFGKCLLGKMTLLTKIIIVVCCGGSSTP